VTTEFLHEAKVQRDALGMTDLLPVVIEHPLSTLTDTEIEERAQQAAAQAVTIWLTQSGGDPAAECRLGLLGSRHSS
jgi:hypothetical protein